MIRQAWAECKMVKHAFHSLPSKEELGGEACYFLILDQALTAHVGGLFQSHDMED